jgi:hypothetical protein
MSVTHNIRRITVMSKKLLSEAQIRRFQSLANLPALNEKYHAKVDDMEEGRYGMEEMEHPKDKEMKEDGHEMEEGAHAKVDDEKVLDEGEHEEKEEMDMEPEMEPEAMPEGGDLDLSEEEARVIIELGKKLEGIMGAGAEMDDMEADAVELGAEDAMDMGNELMEALAGVDVQPSRKEVVEEVARRVARRLNEAKRAQRRLNRALGNK